MESDVSDHADSGRERAKRAECAVSAASDLEEGQRGCAKSARPLRDIYKNVDTNLHDAVDTAHRTALIAHPVADEIDLKTGLTAHNALIAHVIGTFPGSRVTRRRTPEGFKHFWDELTSRSDAHRRGETIGAARLEQLQRRR